MSGGLDGGRSEPPRQEYEASVVEYQASDGRGGAMPYANVNGVKLYYEVHGKGEPFMFIAGTGSSCEYMKVTTVEWLSREFQRGNWRG
jgi:hypothetical protein